MNRRPSSPFATEDGVIVMAHRGNRGHAPENTIVAFRQAAEMGVDALEMDIHSTADGVLVVIHDEIVDRVTNGTGPVHHFTWAELKELDAGYFWTDDGGRSYPFRDKGITIPALAEVFTAFPDLWLNIDIKQSAPSIVTPFGQMIRRFGLSRQVCVGSFDTKTVRQFRREYPEVFTAASLTEARRLLILNRLFLDGLYWGKAGAMQLPEYNGRWHIVTPRFVAAAHRHNMAVHVWTVNEVEQMQHLIEIGVDGLMTDYPARLLKLLHRL